MDDLSNNVETLEVARDSMEDFFAASVVLGLAVLAGGFIGYGLSKRDWTNAVTKAYRSGWADGHNACGRKFVKMLHDYDVPMPDALARDVSAGKVPLLKWDTDKPAAGTPAW